MALLDLIGQHEKKPLYEVLGGRKREQAAIIWRISGAPDEIEMAPKRRDEGFVAFKVKFAWSLGVNPTLHIVRGALMSASVTSPV